MLAMVWYYGTMVWQSQAALFSTDNDNVNFHLCFPTFSVSPFLQFFLLGRSMFSLGQENLIFLQLDFNLNVTWHFMFFVYLGRTNKIILSDIIRLSFLTDNYLSAPSGLVLYITDSPAPILIVFFVTCLLSGQLKSKIWDLGKKQIANQWPMVPKKYLNPKI